MAYPQYGVNYITLQWNSSLDGGAAVLGFHIYYSIDMSTWSTVYVNASQAKNFQLSALTASTTYYFYYTLTNLFGTSPNSPVGSFVTAARMSIIFIWLVIIFISAFCGDGICDKVNGETCSSCFFDCGACSKHMKNRFQYS